MAAKKKASGKAASDAKGKKEEKSRLSLKERVIKALAHPLRVEILDLMNDGEWSPRELEMELEDNLGKVSYHVTVLRDFDLVGMTKTEPRRGAVEHFYRAKERAFVPAGMASRIPKSAQKIIGNDLLQKIDKDVASSLKSGRFFERDDWHISWTPVDVDGEGRREAEELADEFVEGMLEIQARTANRRAEGKSDDQHHSTSAAVLVFGSDLAEKKIAPSRKPAGQRKAKSNTKAKGKAKRKKK